MNLYVCQPVIGTILTSNTISPYEIYIYDLYVVKITVNLYVCQPVIGTVIKTFILHKVSRLFNWRTLVGQENGGHTLTGPNVIASGSCIIESSLWAICRGGLSISSPYEMLSPPLASCRGGRLSMELHAALCSPWASCRGDFTLKSFYATLGSLGTLRSGAIY